MNLFQRVNLDSKTKRSIWKYGTKHGKEKRYIVHCVGKQNELCKTVPKEFF